MYVYAVRMGHKYDTQPVYFRHLKAVDRGAARAKALEIDGPLAVVHDVAPIRKVSDREIADSLIAQQASLDAIDDAVAAQRALPDSDGEPISVFMAVHLQQHAAAMAAERGN